MIAQTALTPEEVGQAFDAYHPADSLELAGPIEEAAIAAFQLIDWRLSAPGGQLGCQVFRDLRPTEAEQLLDLVAAHRDRAEERIRQILREEVVAAALAFADACPTAPLAVRP